MDLIDSCRSILAKQIRKLDESKDLEVQPDVEQSATQKDGQTFPEGYFSDPDKHLNKILNQQAHLKRIIDQDNEILRIKHTIVRASMEIEAVRRSCTKHNEDALANRQELVETQAKELEKYQMNQIKSIAEDYNRHLDILEQRKKEVQTLTKEIEKEESNRDAYLADVEKKLDKQLLDRQKSIRGGSLPFQTSVNNLTGEIDDPNHIELTSVDEYAPYGHPSGARGRPASRARGSKGRGRRKRG